MSALRRNHFAAKTVKDDGLVVRTSSLFTQPETKPPMIYAPLVLVAVLVSARSSAEWIANVTKSDSAVNHRRPVDAKQKLRGHAEATDESNEERVGPSSHLDPHLLPSLMRNGESSATPLAPILKSSIPSLTQDKSVAELLSSHVPNRDVSHLKNNKELTQRMEELGINIDDVVTAVQTLLTTNYFLKQMYSEYSLILMALGSVYFKNFETFSTEIEAIHQHQLKSDMGEYVDSPEFKAWKANHLGVSIQKVYGKMRWLVKFGGLKTCEKQDLADMAFGSEFFKINEIDLSLLLPNSETLFKPKHRIQHLINREDVDLNVKQKLRAFADDPDAFDYSVDEILRRAKDAVLEGKLTHLTTNKAFTQRMKTLEINIDDVRIDVQMLRAKREVPQYDGYSLALMVLGRKFFKKLEDSGLKFGSLSRSKLVHPTNGYVNSEEFRDWKDVRTISGVNLKQMYAKMLYLIEKENLNIKNEELAEMAYGSEYFQGKEINLDLERVKYLIKLLKEQDGINKSVIDKLETELQQDPNSFSGKIAELLERKVKHALLGAELDRETHKRRKIA